MRTGLMFLAFLWVAPLMVALGYFTGHLPILVSVCIAMSVSVLGYYLTAYLCGFKLLRDKDKP